MSRRYAAYLVRHWTLGDGRERVEVQELPSGQSHRYGSLAEAYSALQHRRAPPETPDPSDDPADGESHQGAP
jgi:hypothetical protein